MVASASGEARTDLRVSRTSGRSSRPVTRWLPRVALTGLQAAHAGAGGVVRRRGWVCCWTTRAGRTLQPRAQCVALPPGQRGEKVYQQGGKTVKVGWRAAITAPA